MHDEKIETLELYNGDDHERAGTLSRYSSSAPGSKGN